jgi:hypothetical protein
MKITLEIIQNFVDNNEEWVLTKDEIKRVKKLCEYFGIKEPRMKIALYKVRLPELISANGVQRLVRKKNKFFFVGEDNTLLSGHTDLFELDQIPNRLRQFAEVRDYIYE